MDINARVRLFEERTEVADRAKKLELFMAESPTFQDLGVEDRAYLIEQLGHMKQYQRVLECRIERVARPGDPPVPA